MTDATAKTCPDCGRPEGFDFTECDAGPRYRNTVTREECLRLTVERMRPVVEAARKMIASQLVAEAAQDAYLTARPDDPSLRELSRASTEAADVAGLVLAELRAAVDAYDGKAPTP